MTEDWETAFNELLSSFDLSPVELFYYSQLQ